MPEVGRGFRGYVVDYAGAQHVEDFNVGIGFTVLHECLGNDLRYPSALREDEPIATSYGPHGFLGFHRPFGE